MIYTKTELGKNALQDKSLGLTPKQRSTFIMFDGKRSAAEVLSLTNKIGVTADDLTHLVSLGLLAPVAHGAPGSLPIPSIKSVLSAADNLSSASTAAPLAGQAPNASVQSQYAKAYPIAVRLTSNLGLRGFRLNLAVESSADLEALKDLSPRIKEAVGIEKFRELEDALYR